MAGLVALLLFILKFRLDVVGSVPKKVSAREGIMMAPQVTRLVSKRSITGDGDSIIMEANCAIWASRR